MWTIKETKFTIRGRYLAAEYFTIFRAKQENFVTSVRTEVKRT